MYESPINLVFQDVKRGIEQQKEQMILQAIMKCNVTVDKEELIKAINYDRDQYSKGYKDGVNDICNEIRSEIEKIEIDWQLNKYPSSPLTTRIRRIMAILDDKYKAGKEVRNERETDEEES